MLLSLIVAQESVDSTASLNNLSNQSPLETANLVLVFGSIKRFNENKLQSVLNLRYPTAQIVGCTTSGEISANDVYDDSIQITAIQWEKVIQRVVQSKSSKMQDSFETGANLATQLKAITLRSVVLISDGLHVNGSELINGFQSILG